MNNGANLEVRGLKYRYDTQLYNFEFCLRAGSITALLAESGAGKSTLIQLLAGFLKAESGQVLVNGEDITKAEPAFRHMSVLFQDNNLFQHLTAWQNVALACVEPLKPSGDELEKIEFLFRKTNIDGKQDKYPAFLSGGEKQRVAIARALLSSKPILLLDEPFAALGPGLRQELLSLLLDLQQNFHFTLLFATHSPSDIIILDGDLLFIDQQKIVAHGAAKELLLTNVPDNIKKYIGRFDVLMGID